ncbi:helix-turn-helix domain-containing protein [Mycobacterium sp. MAA66]|uniref:helix-turn-helix domain-containing protein n=1 Tax=Mycobacterium sp. MAA66 TaxID=3156297 RepID=UPI003511596D
MPLIAGSKRTGSKLKAAVVYTTLARTKVECLLRGAAQVLQGPVVHRLLTVLEAATALSISRSSVYRLFDAGQLAWVQIGTSRRVASKEIDRFINAHTENAAS